jgi:hypothetical protein
MSTTAKEHDGSHDFDFFFGRYRAHNKRLVGRLRGSTTWESFEHTSDCRPVLGGLGNMDENVFDDPSRPGFIGMSLRLFDPQTRQWSIYWADNRVGVLQPPVVGSFSNGVGIFEGPDGFEGKPILVRYTWSNITSTSARWEQAFSPDNGQTWETNWIMDFTRA